MPDVQIPLLSTPTQAAAIIGISPRKFRDLVAAHRITVKMLDGRIRVPREAILSFVESIPAGYVVGERPPASRARARRKRH
jgi:excisionase family DNA binding protein